MPYSLRPAARILCVIAGLIPGLALADENDLAGTAHPARWPEGTHGILIHPDTEAFIDKLLGQMTLEEKVGQTIQADITWITPDDLLTYKLGSVQAGGNAAPGNDVRSTPQAWLNLTDAFYRASTQSNDTAHPPIPVLFAIDAVHGHARIKGATIFPHNIGLGAAHDPDLIRRIGQVTADEVATTGIDWSFAPTIAVVRDVRWGRTYESYSEDPTLVSAYAAAMISGLQGDIGTADFLAPRHTITSAKHFLGDGGTTDGHDQGNNATSEDELIRVHGAGYQAAIAAGATTIMASYNSWQGVKMHANHSLLTDVLKDRLGFDGFVVGDWNGQEEIPGCTKFNCPAVFLAGVDMMMGPDGWKELYRNTLVQARAGIIPQARLDDAVRRILRVKVLAGLFDRGPPKDRPEAGEFERLGSAAHRAIAREAVRKSLVLLKNDHDLLPLNPQSRLLIAGDGADNLAKQAGGWTIDWQGDHNTAADFPGATSIYAGLKAAVERAGGTITLSPEGRYARKPDAAIVVFGENPYAEFEGDREHMAYADPATLALLKRFRNEKIPVVSILLSGRPLWVNSFLNASDAFVAAWLPGSEGGGIADVLLRASDGTVPYDFTGKLSFSWPATALPVRLNNKDEPLAPQFARGYGLSYADHMVLPRIPEDPRIPDMLAGHDTLFYAGHVTTPWSIYVADPIAAVRLTTPQQASPDGTLIVTLTEDGGSAVWDGTETATLRFSGHAIDLRRQGALSARYRVDKRPSGLVYLAIACGDKCMLRVDITPRLKSGRPGQWQNLSVPLSAFGRRQLATVETPFALTTDGALGLTFAEIKIVPAKSPSALPGSSDTSR